MAEQWLNKAKEKKYPVTLDGRQLHLSEQKIGEIIKNKLKRSRVVQSLFGSKGIDVDRIDDLDIIITPLERKYAESDEKTMKLNPLLFENGDFFQKQFYIIAHELVHILTRLAERKSYFADYEETQGMALSVAYLLEYGASIDEVWEKVFPKVRWHFHNESDARDFFVGGILEEAKKMLGNMYNTS